MAGDDLKKVTAGDPLQIPAGTWNTFIDVARAWKAGQFGGGAAPRPSTPDRSIALVKNDTGADLDQWSAVGIDGSIITPEENLAEWGRLLAFSVVTPRLPDHEHNFAVTLEPIPQGKIGRAVVSGLVQVKVAVGNRDHTHASVTDGSYLLTSGDSGPAEIVTMGGAETGEQWCVVRWGGGGDQLDLVRFIGFWDPDYDLWVKPNADFVFEGQKLKWIDDALVFDCECWIYVDVLSRMPFNAVRLAKRQGTFTSGGMEKPLYIAQQDWALVTSKVTPFSDPNDYTGVTPYTTEYIFHKDHFDLQPGPSIPGIGLFAASTVLIAAKNPAQLRVKQDTEAGPNV
jgi:hypothetical protein